MERSIDRPTPDILVVGGGILGLATSCELLSRGYSVSIVERDAGKSATRAAGGMLSPWAECRDRVRDAIVGPPLPWRDLLVQARNAFPEFVRNIEETSGCRVECRFPGTLIVSPDPSADLSDLTFTYREMGARATFLDSEDLTAIEPGLDVDSAILLEDEGYVDPRGLHDAMRAAFEELGGSWIQDEVYAPLEYRGRVVGAETGSGQLHAGAVVNTAGAHASRFLLPEDRLRLRPRPVRGEILRLRPPRRGLRIRHVVQSPGFVYLIPQDDGTVLVGATSYEGDGRAGVTAGGVTTLLANVNALVPNGADWEWVAAWSGLRPLAGSGEPTVLADPRPGLFHGLGLFRNGILLAPVIGARLSRLAAEFVGQPGHPAGRRTEPSRENVAHEPAENPPVGPAEPDRETVGHEPPDNSQVRPANPRRETVAHDPQENAPVRPAEPGRETVAHEPPDNRPVRPAEPDRPAKPGRENVAHEPPDNSPIGRAEPGHPTEPGRETVGPREERSPR